MYLLGLDIGSSSIKAALVKADNGELVATAQSPDQEMPIDAPQQGFAEQHPDLWWEHLCQATQTLISQHNIDAQQIESVGIAYQMHGLVVVDEKQQVLRPSIIWCDSRAVSIGNKAFEEIGKETSLQHLLNSPGNFTASKLKWVKENQPEIYEKIHKIMLPGDYIAMKLTGTIATTASGLSEGTLWDFTSNKVADLVLDYYGFDKNLIPTGAPTFSDQGHIHEAASLETGLPVGIPITYRAGDQPNNALALGVLNPGEVAATGGTSGVVYAVSDQASYDSLSRVNSFAHVNHSPLAPRIGILLCINGAGSQYSWIRNNLVHDKYSYPEMDQLAEKIAPGSDGLRVFPFGNGAERMLGNEDTGGRIVNLQFNRHSHAHLYRAALEGIAFSFVHGMEILQQMGVDVSLMRVGNDNLFRSAVFANTISSLLESRIEMVEASGAIGAARASGVAIGRFGSIEEAVQGGNVLQTYEPTYSKDQLQLAFEAWQTELKSMIHA
ncbi:MAG: FGGY family carbohydrate kinase [Bacteroidota bacterium]